MINTSSVSSHLLILYEYTKYTMDTVKNKVRIVNEKNIVGNEVFTEMPIHEETIEFYPFENIYPNTCPFRERKYKDHTVNSQTMEVKKAYELPYAVYYLQKNRVNHLLNIDKVDSNILFDIYGEAIPSELRDNCLELLCSKLKYYYDYKHNSKKVCEIARLLCENNPKLITKRAFEQAFYHKYYYLTDLMASYLVEDNDDDICYICLCSEPEKELLSNLCKCKSKIHIRCAEKLIHYEEKKCNVCISPYKYAYHRKIYFPYDDFYPYPFLTSYPIMKFNNLNDKLYNAMQFLVIDRFRELLKSATRKEITAFFESSDFHELYRLFKEGNMPTNYSRNENKIEYEQIQQIIDEYK